MAQSQETDEQIVALLNGADPLVIETQLQNATDDHADLSAMLRDARASLVALETRRSLYDERLGFETQRIATDVEIGEQLARVSYLESSIEQTETEIVRLSAMMPQLRPLIELQQQQAARIADLRLRLRDSRALGGADVEENVRVIEAAVPPLRASSMSTTLRLAIVGIVSVFAAMSVAGVMALIQTSLRQAREEEAADPAEFWRGSEVVPAVARPIDAPVSRASG